MQLRAALTLGCVYSWVLRRGMCSHDGAPAAGQPTPTLPFPCLQELRIMGAKRTVQLPGMGVLTMPGYAFHFTVSQVRD